MSDDAAVEELASTWRRFMEPRDLEGGRALMREALDVPDAKPTRARALALYGDGVLAFRTGDRAGSLDRNNAALVLARELGDPDVEALAMVGLCRIALRDGDYARVCKLAGQALELVADRPEQARLMPLHLLAAGTRLGGDYGSALALYKESLDLSRRLNDRRMVANELHNLGHVYLHLRRAGDAEHVFAERVRGITGDEDAYGSAMTTFDQACLAYARGDHEKASGLLVDATGELSAAGIALDPDDAFELRSLAEELEGR